MAIVEEHGYPVALHIESASLWEKKLVEATIRNSILPVPPCRLIGDKAYDEV